MYFVLPGASAASTTKLLLAAAVETRLPTAAGCRELRSQADNVRWPRVISFRAPGRTVICDLGIGTQDGLGHALIGHETRVGELLKYSGKFRCRIDIPTVVVGSNAGRIERTLETADCPTDSRWLRAGAAKCPHGSCRSRPPEQGFATLNRFDETRCRERLFRLAVMNPGIT